ncbi:nicotinamide riboside kinase 1-like [Pollicipes pollicipes]|uniref:nicotinamide riboside kinase 1-like n=1 Tax=Pollicipes pollicipes TaxID=41117 RepID=UPI00188581EF|nr:nicotinamide riboside kinase 1-like [Pollicipes pollicipes]XP_037094036.1 nicotinamide riboside kinase 1-like [Pollicipes pollicipes]XP_037094037.1 nicotinamide riboside kinase 1-like [Pollicipes pollicipes]XP_037094172.1 nicotinamide riboside kinase 1-like [Pollicipes pollicipes]
MAGWCVAAVSGVTCGGKTTVARMLHAAYPGSVLVAQDDYFLPEDDPRHVPAPGVNHLNWELLSSIDTGRMVTDVAAILAQPAPAGDAAPRLLIIEGFLVLNDARLRALCDVQCYVTLERGICWERRQHRHYEPADVPGYFDACVWPMYERHLAELRCVDGGRVIYLDGALPLDRLYTRVAAEVSRAMEKQCAN